MGKEQKDKHWWLVQRQTYLPTYLDPDWDPLWEIESDLMGLMEPDPDREMIM